MEILLYIILGVILIPAILIILNVIWFTLLSVLLLFLSFAVLVGDVVKDLFKLVFKR